MEALRMNQEHNEKRASDLLGADLNEYKDYLASEGNSRKTINVKVCRIRKCARVLRDMGDPPITEIDADHIERVEAVLKGEGMASSASRAVFEFGKLVSWYTGDPVTPWQKMVVEATPCDAATVKAAYGEAIDAFIASLGQISTAYVIKYYIIGTLEFIVGRYGIVPIGEITPEMMGYVGDTMPVRVGTINSYLNYTGRFIAFHTGANPLFEFRASSKLQGIEQRIEESRYAKEIMLYRAFLESRDYRPLSIQTKLSKLTSILKIVEDMLDLDDVRNITEEQFFYLRKNVTHLSESTLKGHFQMLSEFVHFLTGSTPYNGRKMLWNPAQSGIKRTFIFRDDWDVILKAADQTQRMMIIAAATLGLRVSEVAAMKLEDFERKPDGIYLTVRGKGHGPNGKVAVKRLGVLMEQELESYLKYRRKILEETGDLSEGNLMVMDRMLRGCPITSDVLRNRTHDLSEAVGISFSPHTFRRFYATTLHDGGIDLDTIRRMMRHEDVNTTMRCYLNADPRKIEEAERMIDMSLS